MTNYTPHQLVEAIKEELHKRLQAKTGWGRNEIESAFNESFVAALLKLAEF